MISCDLLFYIKAGPIAGFGHLRRSLAVASQLKKKNRSIVFLVDGDRSSIDLLKKKGFKTIKYSFAALKLISPSIAVIDQKDDVSSQIKHLKSVGAKICLIDNPTNARLISDVVIFPISHFKDTLSWEGFKGKKYIGAKYFPLNKEFLRSRRMAHKKFTVLVTMGGSDENKLTQKVCSAVKSTDLELNMLVVIGSAFGHQNIPKDRRFKVVRSPKNMAQLMARSDIAVTAFGTTLYELAYMGVPAMIIGNCKQDAEDARTFTKHGTAVWLGNYNDIRSASIIKNICKHRNAPKGMIKLKNINKKLVDGNGVQRIITILTGQEGD
jgi:UDP-2,4-diacetamido-2,4,6-trideoxy-beta-L-altropyranose hydrolase